MSFGMRIWGENANLELDENSFTVQVIYSATITASGRSSFVAIPGVSPSTHSAVVLPIGAYPQDPFGQTSSAGQYIPLVGTNGVTVYFGNPNSSAGPTGTATQRLLVMKFR